MELALEQHNFKSIVAIFYKKNDDNWEGILPDNIEAIRNKVKVLILPNVILVLRAEDATLTY